ncbi:MAG: SDR family oxidoreductase [Pseudomonadota bacterium]
MTALFENQLALVTGAGRGIGRACAEALADGGARVIAIARTASDLAQVARHSSGRIETWQADVTDPALHQRIAALDGLSLVVNNAGGNKPQPFESVDDDALHEIVDLNIIAVFKVARAAVQSMLRCDVAGSIVNMSSQMAHVGARDRSVYCMTKHAVEGLSKACAVELASSRIRVNTVAPTFVETPLTKSMLEQPEFRAFVLNMIPSGRLATVEDIANAVTYLLSDRAGMVTGHSLVVDGGWTAH